MILFPSCFGWGKRKKESVITSMATFELNTLWHFSWWYLLTKGSFYLFSFMDHTRAGLGHAYFLAFSGCPGKQMTRFIKITTGYHGSDCHRGLVGKEVIRNTYWRRRGCRCKWLWQLSRVASRWVLTGGCRGLTVIFQIWSKAFFFSSSGGWFPWERITFVVLFCAF